MKGDIVSAAYVVQNDEPIIYLRIRDKQGKKHELFINDPLVKSGNFRPYFYAPLRQVERFGNLRDVIEIEGGYQDIFGVNMLKVKTRLPRHVKEYRTKKTAEHDVLFPYRFLIDKGIKAGIQFPDGKKSVLPYEVKPCNEINSETKLMYWDIEVESPPEILPLPDNPRFPIVAISCKTDDTERVFQIAKYEETETFKPVPDEKTLLEEFIQFVRKCDVDALVGYNASNYDEPYFFKRCKILGINYRKIAPLNEVFEKSKGRPSYIAVNEVTVPTEARYDIRGLTQIDLLALYKSMMIAQSEVVSWSLKSVSKKAGFEYEDAGDQIRKLHGKKELAKYALNDVKATKIVNEELDLIPLYDRLRRLAGCPIEVAHLNSLVVDFLCLRMSDKVLNKPPEAKLGDKLHGAYVMHPEPGLHENVAIFDLSSMYPSIMITFNVSPETKEVINSETNDHLQGIKFNTEEKGILPRVVKQLTDERDKLRNVNTHVANLHEWAIKFLVCSVYGVFAFKGFRLYDNDCANYVTSHGRRLIKKLAKKVEQELDTKTRYVDTDSLFVTIPEEKTKEAEKLLKSEILSYCRSHGATAPTMDIKLDNYCEKLFFKCRKERGEWIPTKKKYVYQEDGEIKIKGFAPRRVTSSPVTARIFLKFFNVLFNKGKQTALEFLTNQRESFKQRNPLEIAIPRGVNKPLHAYKRKDPWVEGLKFMRDNFDQTPREDWKAKLLYTKSVKGYGKQDCISVYEEVPKETQIDWEKMRRKTIDNKFDGIIKALGEEPDYILRPVGQSALEEF